MSNQVALVTGASRGIGFGIAMALAREGFAVALNGQRDSEQLRNSVALVEELGVPAVAIPFDVADLSLHDSAILRVEESLGPLTTLVNNAGVSVLNRGDPLDVTEESWNRCLEVNAKSQFFLTRQFSRRLLTQSRDEKFYYSVINVTSANAVAAAENRVEYCASKAAASMVSKCFAVRLAREGISVFDVQPGLISTDMTASVIDEYAQRSAAGLTLIPRVGQADEIGAIVANLATGKLPYTTGQTISADGGLLVPRF